MKNVGDVIIFQENKKKKKGIIELVIKKTGNDFFYLVRDAENKKIRYTVAENEICKESVRCEKRKF